MTGAQRRAWQEVIDRDNGLCMCGRAANQVHHIIARSHASGKRPPDWLWDKRNLISICPACHLKAHNPKARIKVFTYLAERHGYNYVGAPWQEYLNG